MCVICVDDKIVKIIFVLTLCIKLPMGEHAPSLQQEEIYINSSGSLLVRRATVFARRDQLLFSGEQAHNRGGQTVHRKVRT